MATKKTSAVAKTDNKAIEASKIVVPEQLNELFAKVEATPDEASSILVAFGVPLTEAGVILQNYQRDEEGAIIVGENTIVVDSADQTELMAQARADRLKLKKIRTDVEKDRKKMKEGINRQGQMIDGVARYIREEIEPAEKYLQLQEDYIKIAEEKAAAERNAKRTAEIAELGADPAIYSLHDMSEDAYQALITTIKDANEARIAREKAEAEAEKAKAEAEAAENARIRAENEKLRAEAEAREAAAKVEREKAAAEQAKKDAELEAERAKVAAAEKAEADRIAAEEAEKARIAKEEADKKAAEEAAAKAAATAPDKVKLANFMLGLEQVRETKLPEVESDEAKEIVAYINAILERTVTTVNTKIEAL